MSNSYHFDPFTGDDGVQRYRVWYLRLYRCDELSREEIPGSPFDTVREASDAMGLDRRRRAGETLP